jgi:hypothetical protein
LGMIHHLNQVHILWNPCCPVKPQYSIILLYYLSSLKVTTITKNTHIH